MNKKEALKEKQFRKCYQLISDYYGDTIAMRSGVPLINHINEGVAILSVTTEPFSLEQAAFCVHPLFQNNLLEEQTKELSDKVRHLALEYTKLANGYLCKPETDHLSRNVAAVVAWLEGENPSDSVLRMLLADKIQNRKDFLMYNASTHERSSELAMYFNTWISAISEIQFKRLRG